MRDLDSITVYVELPGGNKILSFDIDNAFTASEITTMIENDYNAEVQADYDERVAERNRTRVLMAIPPPRLVDLTLTAHSSANEITFGPNDRIVSTLERNFGRERTHPLLVVQYELRERAANSPKRVTRPKPTNRPSAQPANQYPGMAPASVYGSGAGSSEHNRPGMR